MHTRQATAPMHTYISLEKADRSWDDRLLKFHDSCSKLVSTIEAMRREWFNFNSYLLSTYNCRNSLLPSGNTYSQKKFLNGNNLKLNITMYPEEICEKSDFDIFLYSNILSILTESLQSISVIFMKSFNLKVSTWHWAIIQKKLYALSPEFILIKWINELFCKPYRL